MKDRSMKPRAVILLAVLLAGCNGKFSATEPKFAQPGPTPTPAPVVSYQPQEADNRVSADLYGCERSDSDNVFFSPFSIITALAMAQEGARGGTQTEMQRALYLSTDDNTRRTGFQALLAEINKPGKSYELSTSNHLWVEQTFSILPAYQGIVTQYYGASVANLDMKNDPAGSANTINNAVSSETNGKITDLIAPSNIKPDTKFILTNAIYFNADWARAFPPSATFPRVFTTGGGGVVQASMMNQDMPGAIEDYYGKAQVLEIPYKNNDVSMFVFLPPAGQTAGLESEMTAPQLNQWFANRVPPSAGSMLVALSLPKFNFKTKYDLKDPLQSLGMISAFDGAKADFSGIDGQKDLMIDFVVHQAFVAVDEKGTTAAAATGVGGVGITSVSFTPPTVPFVVDHPFFFALYENRAHCVLFFGKVNDPTK